MTKRRINSLLARANELAAKDLALAEFPNELWVFINGVYVSQTRITQSQKSKNATDVFEKEMAIAMLLVDNGYFVWLLPENRAYVKNPDAIINGRIYDFKQVNFKQIEHAFLNALEQADNVVLRIVENRERISRILGKLRKYAKKREQGTLILILDTDVRMFEFESI
jgi:uncharacterized UPF0160 family protein